MLKEQLIKDLIPFGEPKDLLIENEIAFKIKGVHKCIFKFPYNKNTAQLLAPVDGNTTPKSK